MRWTADYTNRGSDIRPRTWNGALRAMRADERRLRALAVASAAPAWEFAVEEFSQAGYSARPIATPLELTEEAIAMKHCADQYMADCHESGGRFYSLRSDATGRRVATVHLVPGDAGMRLADVRGTANTLPSPVVLAIASALVDAYSQALREAAQDAGEEAGEDLEEESDDDEENPSCPICGDTECDAHLVASIDIDEGVMGGGLYSAWQTARETLRERLMEDALEGRRRPWQVDELRELQTELAEWRSTLVRPGKSSAEVDPDALEDQWCEINGDARLCQALCEWLDEQGDVIGRSFEISHSPCLTWVGTNYYCEDPAVVAARLAEAFVEAGAA